MKIQKQRQGTSDNINKPSSSSTSSSSSSSFALSPRKRLLSGSPKPNNAPAPCRSRSRSRSPTISDHPHPALKKTRDLPNLSQCHACGFRTDTGNGKQRLQTLYSEWRIVLLCKKCAVRVESSEICSYCFQETLAAECFCCGECNRRVHRDCFKKYRTVAPWSYSCSGEEFSVCVDCWVPRPIALSRALFGGRKIRRRDKSGGKARDSRILDGAKSLKDVAENANCVAKKKIEEAAKARVEAVRKAVVARRAVELATNALDFVASRDENGEKVQTVDDAELAFQLHRAMNSSPRISRNLWENKGDSLVGGSCSGYPNVCGKLEPDRSVLEPVVCAGSLDGGSSMNVNCLKSVGKIETSGVKDGECQMRRDSEFGILGVRLEGEGSCSIKLSNSNGDDNSMDSANRSSHQQHKPTMPKDKRYNGEPDRYPLKYCRRNRK
ncbi:hypothetical protein I3843_05G038000 [Carya illinoinensis]|uniref:Uncharacterized protein n=1 Tax=Carya illinoinensis TaxID=32201 RepID=A0A922EVT5_CARIL|nr:hypothetical protein I3760_05G041100 [Carya illinoinensis]KAG2705196.1 hypothetical protein I3760_05G041100 [Carya illinoinensis]KAG2705197.1 hypothetical protein I3760_05G041100 [Carya illinoinensis]KAG6711183.1 hypothetical protein I3842_05G040600 [Carya illinoinensis]KAG6711184.1 hypothetical protein I3842_05G040600 [Carya illinoinensis]